MDQYRKFECSGGEVIEMVDIAALTKHSKVVASMIEACAGDSTAPILLTKLDGATFRKVVEWCIQHKYDQFRSDGIPGIDHTAKYDYSVYGSKKMETRQVYLDPWDEKFCKRNQELLMPLVMAANFLKMDGLIDVACKAIANQIADQSPRELRNFFNIEKDSKLINPEVFRRDMPDMSALKLRNIFNIAKGSKPISPEVPMQATPEKPAGQLQSTSNIEKDSKLIIPEIRIIPATPEKSAGEPQSTSNIEKDSKPISPEVPMQATPEKPAGDLQSPSNIKKDSEPRILEICIMPAMPEKSIVEERPSEILHISTSFQVQCSKELTITEETAMKF